MATLKCKELAHQLANWIEEFEDGNYIGEPCFLCFVCQGTRCEPEYSAQGAMFDIGFEQGDLDDLQDIICIELGLRGKTTFSDNRDRIEFLRGIASS